MDDEWVERHRQAMEVIRNGDFLAGYPVGDISNNSDINVDGGEQVSSCVDAQSAQPGPVVQSDASQQVVGPAPSESPSDVHLLEKPPEVDH